MRKIEGRDKGNEVLYSDEVIPALENAAKHFSSKSTEAAWEMEDAVDQIKYGKARSTEHRKYLDTDEQLRIPLFAKRPVQDKQHNATKKRPAKKIPLK